MRALDLRSMHEHLDARPREHPGHPHVIRVQVRDEGAAHVAHRDAGVRETLEQRALGLLGVKA